METEVKTLFKLEVVWKLTLSELKLGFQHHNLCLKCVTKANCNIFLFFR